MQRVRPLPSILADVVPTDPAIDRVEALCAKAARSTLPVLIEGETGTGKQFYARAIHQAGDRAAKPLVVVDCAKLSWAKILPTLFGVARTDGASDPGKFRAANGGTLVLEEIADLPAEALAGLFRFLEASEIQPVGGKRPERVNVRLIATSSRRLLNAAQAGDFREDLYYRLTTLPIYLPPLRGRADLAARAHHFLARSAAEMGKAVTGISPDALTLLETFDWPGNVRQLENTILRAVALAEGETLQPVDFPQIHAAIAGRAAAARLAETRAIPSEPIHIDFARSVRKQTEGPVTPDRFLTEDGEVTPLARLERELIVFAIGQYRGRMSRIARALGIGRSTLYRKLRDYGLEGSVRPDVA